MQRTGTAQCKEVRGLSRGLDVLRVLNSAQAGELRIGEIAARTRLHRTTVRRLLETLAAEGYVQRSASDDSFRLALRVRSLSEGFTDDEWIADIAPPILGDLLKEVLWPTDLCTPDGDALIIRETTHRFSSLSFHRSMVGVRLPMLFTSTGRAYLAFCPDAERANILALMRRGHDEQAELARNDQAVQAIIRRTREARYGANFREWRSEQKIASIAVPVRHGGRVLGCLNIVYLAQAMPIEEAARRYLLALQNAAGRIEARLRAETR